MNRFFNDTKYAISWGIFGLFVVSILASAFLLVKTVSEMTRDYTQTYPNTISVNGRGEVVAIPDIATFDFSVVEASEDVASAQKLATDKINKVLAFLKQGGVEEKDLKTLSYNIYPKYEWIQPHCVPGTICPRGKNELVGYEVSQTVKVKVREIEKAGELLSGLGEFRVSNVGGINFEIDDAESLKIEATSLAIADARAKAKKLAKDLGVNLKEVVSFSEASDYYAPEYRSAMMTVADGLGGGSPVSPEIPAGENTIVKQVYVTFKIK